MSKRTETDHQVVIESQKTTQVYEKNSVGLTDKEGHSTYHKDSGNTTDHYGNIISTGGRDGHKKSK
jgi:hypothetical protein